MLHLRCALPENRAHAQALSGVLTGKEEALSQDMLIRTAACLLDLLAGHCSSKSALPVDRPFSRYFYTLLRTMQTVVSQVRLRLL